MFKKDDDCKLAFCPDVLQETEIKRWLLVGDFELKLPTMNCDEIATLAAVLVNHLSCTLNEDDELYRDELMLPKVLDAIRQMTWHCEQLQSGRLGKYEGKDIVVEGKSTPGE